MVQLTIAYVALGFGVLLLLAGILTFVPRSSSGVLSLTQRRILIGGLGGMIVFITGLFFWLR